MTLSLFFLLFLVFLSQKYKYRSFVFVYAVWYFAIITDYLFVQDIFVPFSSKFDTFFLYFSFLFIFLYLIVDSIIYFSGNLRVKKISFFNYRSYFLFSVFLAFISLFIFIRAFILMPINGIRETLVSGELSFRVGLSFPFVSSCLFYQNLRKIEKNKKFLVFILFLLAFISTSKQFIVLAFLFSVPWYTKNFKCKVLPFVFIGIFGFLLIFILHAFTGRVAGSGNLLQKTLYTINGYFLGGIAVFQLFLDGTMQQHITTGSWVKTGKWIGNVYSGFYSFYQNYSLLILSVKILGISILYAFLNSRKKSLFLNFLRIYSIYPLLFFIFSDLYLPAIKQWFVFCIAGFCLILIKERKSV